MPKRKAKKLTDKDYRNALLARLERIGTTEEIVGEVYPEESLKGFNEYDKYADVRIDMSFKTEDIRCALVSFYNGRGNSVACYIPNDTQEENKFGNAIAKVVCFGLTTAMALPADDVYQALVGLEIEGLEYYGPGGLDAAECARLNSKPSMKWVSIKSGNVKPTFFERLTFSASSSLTVSPYSAVTNNSSNLCPENDKVVAVHNFNTNQETLGKAILQRAVLALSREEAKLHPDGKYHGERMKWADV